MGHDITAIQDINDYLKYWNNLNLDFNEPTPRDKLEVAYLRRNAWSDTIKLLYGWLYCEGFYAGCSGNGQYGVVKLETLKEAKKEVKESNLDKEDKKDYSDFINKCIKWLVANDKLAIVISFG